MKNTAKYALIALVISLFAAGCKKNPDSSPFSGNYYGSMTSQSGQGSTFLDALKVTSTNNSSVISIFDSGDSVYLTANVSGNNITGLSGTMLAPNSNFTAITMSGQGTLSGNVLTLKAYGTYTYLGNNQQQVDTFSFTGTK